MANDRTSVLFRQWRGSPNRCPKATRFALNPVEKARKSRNKPTHPASHIQARRLRAWGFATALGGGQPGRLFSPTRPAARMRAQGPRGPVASVRRGLAHCPLRFGGLATSSWRWPRSVGRCVRSVGAVASARFRCLAAWPRAPAPGGGFPQLDPIAFRVLDPPNRPRPSNDSVCRVPLPRSVADLLAHGVEVAHPEVHHGLLVAAPEEPVPRSIRRPRSGRPPATRLAPRPPGGWSGRRTASPSQRAALPSFARMGCPR